MEPLATPPAVGDMLCYVRGNRVQGHRGLAAIIDGGAASGGSMAPLGDALSAEQEAAVLEFVHSLWTEDQRLAHEDGGGHTP